MNFEDVRHEASIKFNQMSDEKLKMSGKAPKLLEHQVIRLYFIFLLSNVRLSVPYPKFKEDNLAPLHPDPYKRKCHTPTFVE